MKDVASHHSVSIENLLIGDNAKYIHNEVPTNTIINGVKFSFIVHFFVKKHTK